ncbi:MAG: tyrosine-type recombinase/integrase, partial [Streptosporangiaceae bacterium]
MAACGITGDPGEPARVTAHRFRHTYASRLINSEVSQEVVRRLLDHTSHTMTARHARLADTTIRAQWERAQKINIRGEPVRLPADGTLGDAAWMKHNLARAKIALPNGYCGLPLQKSCPHANACLTCPLFITTAEFLPEHHHQPWPRPRPRRRCCLTRSGGPCSPLCHGCRAGPARYWCSATTWT